MRPALSVFCRLEHVSKDRLVSRWLPSSQAQASRGRRIAALRFPETCSVLTANDPFSDYVSAICWHFNCNERVSAPTRLSTTSLSGPLSSCSVFPWGPFRLPPRRGRSQMGSDEGPRGQPGVLLDSSRNLLFFPN